MTKNVKAVFLLSVAAFSIQPVFSMYHQKMGRFITQDPLGIQPAGGVENLLYAHLQYIDGANLYEYVQDRALFYTDPMGLSWCILGCHLKSSPSPTQSPQGGLARVVVMPEIPLRFKIA